MYLNVDLEIRSRSDLMPLVTALQRRLSVLHAARVRGTFFASFETSGMAHPPDIAIGRLARALLELPPSIQKLWKQAGDRVFDIGVARAAGNTALPLALRRQTVKTIAHLNARVALTLYPQTWRAPTRLPNKRLERPGATSRADVAAPNAGRSAAKR